jgi:hypothetical protein
MSINYQIHNIFHNILTKQKYPKNILYTYTESLFDKAMEDIPDTIMINNQVFLNIPLSYGLCIINDPLDFAQNIGAYNNLFANKVLFFHDGPPPSLKKEDLFLLKTSLQKFPSFSFSLNHEQWMNQSIQSLNYGIKNIDIDINKEKDIVILSTKNHKQTKLIYDNLKQAYPNTDLLTINSNQSYEDIIKIISKYKICIDLGSYYNVLCGVSVGCYGITTKKSYQDDYIYQISDYQQLIGIVKDILSSPININDMRKYIEDKYCYESFIQKISNIITNYSAKAVLL